jgi:hypothetical protein
MPEQGFSPMKAPLIIVAMAGAIAFTSSAFAQVPDLPTQKSAPGPQPDMQGLPDNEKLGGPAQKDSGATGAEDQDQSAAPAESGDTSGPAKESPDKD